MTEGPARLQSMVSLRVRQDWMTSLSLFTFLYWRRKWQPTPVSFLENPRDKGSWWAAVYGVAQSQTWLKRLSSSSYGTFIEVDCILGIYVIRPFYIMFIKVVRLYYTIFVLYIFKSWNTWEQWSPSSGWCFSGHERRKRDERRIY